MKHFFLLFLLSLMAIHSQTKIRLGDVNYSSNKVLYTIDGSLSISRIAVLSYLVL